METKIFPSAILNNSVEVYDSQIRIRSKVIYLIALGLILLALASLPLIVVDVAVQTRGTFQSSIQRNPIQIPTGGRLESWNLSENQEVKQGEVLAVIRGEQLNLEMKALKERLDLLQDFIQDLNLLINHPSHEEGYNPRLKSNLYQASLYEYQSQLLNQETLVKKLDRDFQRAKILFESKSIAFAEFDEVQVQYQQASTQLELLKKQRLNQWGQELVNHSTERDRIISQLEVSQEQMDQFKVIAGTSGTLMNVQNLNAGDFVYHNQKLAEISPDSELMAVTYISPADIAFLKIGQEVKFQVDAYNYNQWGVATGKVVEIANDLALISEKEAGFLVTCKLDSLTLKLPSGQSGEIRKGMTFNARFVVARRSLFQLLYDKVDNWLNPSMAKSA
ncbi:HlyD family secretion protein [Algoriphagus alkaliphilus]|uniref:HlyD family secretion protein n=1 Tax=Algoriphagus alkaliphilus TaxID=279824 RepID=A0A1G5Y916_9BACT|nr:HlyD family efflux transporter periplasmic adaptor subunit [Algoriphagus alkaliphilus]SDA79208.1 HlyD family secretion protein [Algoriphagus alkaliphilus]